MFSPRIAWVPLLLATAWAQTEQQVLLPPNLANTDSTGSTGEKRFTLRHVYHHGTHDHPGLHRYIDIPQDRTLYLTEELNVQTQAPGHLEAGVAPMRIQRMADRSAKAADGLFSYALNHGHARVLGADEWTVDDVAGPNTTDKKTVVTFAKIAANAYVTEPWGDEWQDVKGGFNYTADFGWQLDGLRGHIFADETNSTVVIGLKGTSMAFFDGKETTGHDKLNDNLFGSCCCAQGVHYAWKPACDCMTSQYNCNTTCLVKSLQEKGHYYWAARHLYHNVTERYPKSDIWLAGHSLGGVVSSLLGLTYGLPTLTFETYPDALAASRLGLPTPPEYPIGSAKSPESGIHHYGHTADPIFAGTCNAWNSGCTIGGYAFEGQCHTGVKHVYDTVKDHGWHVLVTNHRMNTVVPDVLEKYDEVPAAEEDTDCQDCYLWKFFDSNGTETTTTMSSATSTGASSTTTSCKTPGWWGAMMQQPHLLFRLLRAPPLR
ncbi:putative fungal lipase-like domain, alpha/Beta hydrolase [Septoria linicola]|nr:putative fungal lipase-like domain, alpha/Beta hydrolase [Septoria linicola]